MTKWQVYIRDVNGKFLPGWRGKIIEINIDDPDDYCERFTEWYIIEALDKERRELKRPFEFYDGTLWFCEYDNRAEYIGCIFGYRAPHDGLHTYVAKYRGEV